MHSVKLLMTEFVTHDVKRFIVERPEGYTFEPGQAASLAIDQDTWRDEKRPFTFTSHDDDRVLEFTIKAYPDHQGFTAALHELRPGASLLIGDAWGTIQFQGMGTYIAGGAGITPFIAILRDLYRRQRITGNRLVFSNKTARDIILEQELREVFGNDFHPVLTEEKRDDCHHGRIDKRFLQDTLPTFSQHFYLCGPKSFVSDVKDMLEALGASPAAIVVED